MWFTSVLCTGGHCTVKSRTALIKVKTRPSAEAQRCLALRLTCAASVRSAPWVDFFSPKRLCPRSSPVRRVLDDSWGWTREPVFVGRNRWSNTGPIQRQFLKQEIWTIAVFYVIDAFLLLFIPEENKEIIVKVKNPKLNCKVVQPTITLSLEDKFTHANAWSKLLITSSEEFLFLFEKPLQNP